MKLRLLASLLALSVIAAPLVRAQDAASAPKPAASSEDKTDLDKQMDQVGKAFRTLGKQISDPTKNDASAALVGKMIDALKGGLDMTPAKAADLPDDQKADFIAKYKKGIQGMIDKLVALQGLIAAGKNDAAAAALADIKSAEKDAHKEFRKEKPQS